MPIRWGSYLGSGKATKLSAEGRRAIEGMVEELLGIPAADRAREWGEAIGYGLYAAVVVRVGRDVPHEFRGQAPEVAVKVCNNAAARTVAFQALFREARLPGVQRTLAAGCRADGAGKRRGYVVLEYVPGLSLEAYLERHAPIPRARARAFLACCFKDLLVPLWSQGYRFWDFRPANLVVDPDGARLTMIDTDTLRGTYLERLERPGEWARQDEWERLALTRDLPRLVAVMLASTGQDGRAARRTAGEGFEVTGLAAALRRLGRDGEEAAVGACLEAVDRLLQWV